MKRSLLMFTFLISLLAINSCGSGGSVVFSEDREPKDFKLEQSMPEIFQFKLAEDGNYNLNLEITYFSEQMQGNETLMLYYILEGSSPEDATDGKFTIPLKDGDKWKGELAGEGGMDYKIKHSVATAKQLKKGDYTFKLYSDAGKDHPILGMVKITFSIEK